MGTATMIDPETDAATETPMYRRIRIVRQFSDLSTWSDDAETQKRLAQAGSVWAWYLYDETRAVHLCELTPSRELHYIGWDTEDAPEDDDEREDFWQFFAEAFLHEQQEKVIYIHCGSADRMPCWRGDLEAVLPGGTRSDAEDDLHERAYNEWIDDHMDRLAGSPPDTTMLSPAPEGAWWDENEPTED